MQLRRARREFLFGLGLGLGTTALNALLAQEQLPAAKGPAAGPLAAKAGHHPAKAKACICLFMEGGPSHIDTFDPKPKLADLHLQEFQRQDKFASQMSSGKRYYIQSPFAFRQAGHSGLPICDKFEHLAGLVD
jgi:hypothetical protein